MSRLMTVDLSLTIMANELMIPWLPIPLSLNPWNGKWSGPLEGAAFTCTVPVSMASLMRMAVFTFVVNRHPCQQPQIMSVLESVPNVTLEQVVQNSTSACQHCKWSFGILLTGYVIQAIMFLQCSVNTPQEQSTCTRTGNTKDMGNQWESYATLCTLLF